MKPSSRHIILFYFSLVCSFVSVAQVNYIDSIKRILPAQRADTNKVTLLINLSNIYRFSDPDSALVYAQQALSLAEKLNSDYCKFWSIVAINGVLYVSGNYPLELDYAFKALPLAQKLNNPYTIGYSNGMLSDCYYNLGEYNTSLQYWRKVIKIGEESVRDELFSIYANTSRIFKGLQQYDSALIYSKRGYELFKHMPLFKEGSNDSKWAKSSIYTSLGDGFAGKACFDSALFYYRLSMPLSDGVHMELNKTDACNGIAQIYKDMNRPDSAIWFAKKVIDGIFAKKYPLAWIRAATILAETYELKKNPDSSLKYLHIAVNGKDSLFNRERTTAFRNIIFKEQEKQKEVEAAEIKLQTRYKMYFLLAGIIIFSTAAGILLRNSRLKQLQNIRNSIADDLHDDMGSTLSSISIMSELAKAKSPEALSLLSSIGENTVILQENMSDLLWAINTKNDRLENVVQRMKQFAIEILDPKNIELHFTSDTSVPGSKLTMEQRKNFYLFFKEVINNAAKYSDAKKVSVSIGQKSHQIEMNITDDGKGFDPAVIPAGNGMGTLKKRAAELSAYFNIQSCISKGTVVQLHFKIT